ncbi:arginase [Tissierella creatinini]|nr:arginase [Tissierella creatinini]TJX66740.1 arginase [Soehngenia saccharolytica]
MNPNINSNISIIGVAMDLGAGTPGVALGPSALRYAGLTKRLEDIGYDIEDTGDIMAEKNMPPYQSIGKLKFLEQVVKVNTDLCNKVSEVMEKGRFPLILGGDHSIAIGTIAGILQYKNNPGIIWFDAHADINTEETSPTGNIHGMPVAVSLGFGHEKLISIGGDDKKINPEKIVYIGCRDVDAGEKRFLKELGITVFTMHEVDKYGMTEIIERAIKIAGTDTDGIHVSFDLDSLDPLYVMGTGTRVPGGLSYRESNFALEMIAQSGKLISAEFVEVNPLIDHKNRTAKYAVALIGSLLGEWLI